MKNLVLFILGILLGAIIVYFYCCNQTIVDMAPPPPKGIISPDEARLLDQTYNDRYELISDSIVTREGGDNRSSWYSLEDVENFITLAKMQAKDLGYTMNGIRIYLGANPADAQGPGYTTMFMMPTGYENGSEGNLLNLSMKKADNGDIPGGNGLDKGDDGMPPSANYPQ